MNTYPSAKAIVVAILIAPVAAFADSSCQPEETDAFVFHCSRAVMDAGTRAEGFYVEKFGREIDEPLPGAGTMIIDGLVSDGGRTCVMPVSEPTIAGSLLSQNMNAAQLPESLGELAGALEGFADIGSVLDPGAAGQQVGRYLDAQRGGAGTYIQVFSPDTMTWLGQVPTGGVPGGENDGVAGWSPGSTANLVVLLPGVDPRALREGETYPAEAIAGGAGGFNPFFYADWKGESRRFQTRGDLPEGWQEGERLRQQGLRDLQLEQDTIARHTAPVGQGVALSGVQRRVTGRLTGTVKIDAITEAAVRGTVALSGVGELHRVEQDFRFTDGQLSGGEIVSDTKETGPMTIQATFEAPNLGDSIVARPMFTSARVPPQRAEEGVEAPFAITRHWPARNEMNLPVDGFEGWIEFDRGLDPRQDIGTAVTLGWYDSAGTRQLVDLDIRVEGAKLQMRPREPLLPGVWYDVKLEGVRAADRSVLPDTEWRIATIVAPIEDDLDLKIYQTAANAPLIEGKNTLARIYFDWLEPDNVSPDWLVRSFDADVWTQGDSGEYLHARETRTIEPEDAFDREDRRHALHTTNLYGWRPVLDQTSEVVAAIEPLQCGAEPTRFEIGRGVSYAPDAADLRLAVYMLRVGEWRDGIPDADYRIARALIDESLEYITQVLPVKSTSAIFLGDMEISLTSQQRDAEMERATNNADRSASERLAPIRPDIQADILHAFHDRVAIEAPGDISIVFTPAGWLRSAGKAIGPDTEAAGIDSDGFAPVVSMLAMQASPKAFGLPVIAHEIGHLMGLPHYPYSRDGRNRKEICDVFDGTVLGGIEGFRISQTGAGGRNKSSTEGNGENPTTLLPLMYPCARGIADQWISNDQYERAQRVTSGLGGWGPARVHTVSEATLDLGTQAAAPAMLVGGRVTGDTVLLDVARPIPGSRPLHRTDGNFEIQSLDVHGGVVSSAHFQPTSTGHFRVQLSGNQSATAWRVLRDGEELAVVSRPDGLITIHDLRAQATADAVTVSWRAEARSARPAFATLFWRDANEPWQAIQLGGLEGTAKLPPAADFARLVVDDGFTIEERTIAIETAPDGSALVLSANRVDEDGYTVVAAYVAEDLDPASVPGNVVLVDGAGNTLPYQVTYEPPIRRLYSYGFEVPDELRLVISGDVRRADGSPLGPGVSVPVR